MYRIGFDVGGTFTDFTLHDTAGGMLRHFKVPSTPADPSEAIEGGLRMLLDTLHTTPGEISCPGHSTTIATNMVIESRGVAAGCIMTMGFHDSSGDRPSVAAASLRLHHVHAGAAAPRVPPGGVGTHRCGRCGAAAAG